MAGKAPAPAGAAASSKAVGAPAGASAGAIRRRAGEIFQPFTMVRTPCLAYDGHLDDLCLSGTRSVVEIAVRRPHCLQGLRPGSNQL